MKRIISIILALFMMAAAVSLSEEIDYQDPVVGAWATYTMSESMHSFRILVFYPDGVMWDHFSYVENDKIMYNTPSEKHWSRTKDGDLIVDSRDKKLPAYFYGDDTITVVDGETSITYLRMKNPYDVLFRAAADRCTTVITLDPGKGYLVGEDIPEGCYLREYGFDFGRFYIYSSMDNFKKEISSSTEMVGSEAGKEYEFSTYFFAGQVIKVNQPGCIIYLLE